MRILFAPFAFCLSTLLLADGGAIQCRKQAGSLRITLFGAPAPLRSGATDLSVLIQDERNGRAVLDADVQFRLSRPGEKPVYVSATRTQAANKLLYAAHPVLASAGEWRVSVQVRSTQKAAAVDCVLNVLPRQPSIMAYWLYIALVPAGILLFLLNQSLKSRSRPVQKGAVLTDLKMMVREKKSWVDSGSGSLPSEW